MAIPDRSAPPRSPPAQTGQFTVVGSDGPSCPHSQTETASRVDLVLPWRYRTVSQY